VSAWYGVLIDMKIPLVVTIIPGNLNSGQLTQKLIFHLKLPLAPYRGDFHVPMAGMWPVFYRESGQRTPVTY